MNENLSEAFIILVVGMITVFIILSLVVLTGQILIRITNRYAPPAIVKNNSSNTIVQPPSSTPLTINQNNSFDKKKLAAIVGAVEHLTLGKGRVEKIEKIK